MKKYLPILLLGSILTASILLYGFLFNGNKNLNSPKTTVESELPNRRALYGALREHGKMLLVHNFENQEALSLLEDLKKGLSYQRRAKLDVEIKHESKIGIEELSQNPVFYVGAHPQSQYLGKLTASLPIDFQSSQFIFDSKTYEASDVVFKFSLVPHALNEEFPFYMISGNNNKAIYNYLNYSLTENPRSIFRNNWSYELLSNNEQLIFGDLNEENWSLDKITHYDFSSGHQVSVDGKHFRFTSYCPRWPKKRLQELLAACNETLAEITSFTGKAPESLKINYSIYPSVENKGLRLGNNKQAHCDFNNGMVHVVANEYFAGNHLQKENQIILRRLLGKPQQMALEKGLAVYFTKNWQEKGYQYWAHRLFRSGNLPPLKDLLNNDLLETESEYVMNSSAGALVDFLIDKWGKEAFLEKYLSWKVQPNNIQKLEKAWLKFLDKYRGSIQTANISKKLPYLKGFNFAHEGYSIYNGYGSKLAGSSLDRIKKLNGNAIAIVPYSYMQNPNQPSFIPIAQSAGSENDEAVIFAHAEAQKKGMKTILKPQIWFGRGYWPGDVHMESESDWKAFFNYYHRWIRHYALIAEMYEFDALCLGVEFAKATLARPDDWVNLIKQIKQLYSGPITYAANWGDEFENISFWNEIDYIGIDCYYPLSKNEQATKAELDQNFKKILSKIEKVSRTYKKPVLFTEIGFRSVDQTWLNPHEDAKGRASNGEAQKVCYEVVFENIQGKDWCSGLLWWKWPSNLEGSDGKNTRFTPFAKPAEEVIGHWFSR